MKLPKDISLFSQVSFLDRLLFTKHLSVMLKAGIPIEECVATLKDQAKNPAFKKVLTSIIADLENGQTLGKSLNRYPRVFEPLYRDIVNIGEESGNLDQNLEYLAREMAKSYEFKKKVQSALLYPTIIITLALVVGGGISVFVLPQLVDLFKSLDIKLPLSTRILLGFALVMKNYGIVIIISLICLIGLIRLMLQTSAVKPFWHRLLLKLPIVGGFKEDVSVVTFCRNLGIMLKSGLPIDRALDACEEAEENFVFKGYIYSLGQAVDKGKSLESELSSNRYPRIPPIVGKMVGVGERTGKLDESLLYLGDFFAEEVDEFTRNLPTILEPIILIFVAIMVAFLAFSIISPIYEFTANIRK